VISEIRDEIPNIARMLKILLPTMFPILRSALPFLAATIDVIISGSGVQFQLMQQNYNMPMLKFFVLTSLALSINTEKSY
jgi:hypothetical protein